MGATIDFLIVSFLVVVFTASCLTITSEVSGKTAVRRSAPIMQNPSSRLVTVAPTRIGPKRGSWKDSEAISKMPTARAKVKTSWQN